MNGYLRIDLANNCNIRCIMCQAYNAMPVSSMEFLDFDTWAEKTAGSLGSWHTIQLGHVAEPTVHPRFADFVRHIRRESDCQIHIVTNGKLLSRYVDVINEVGNCLVQVSMDSIQEKTHEYIRHGSNFWPVFHQLPLIDRKTNKLLLSFTLMASNIDEYEQILSYCQKEEAQLAAFPMILRDENGVIPERLVRESLWFNKNKLKDWLNKFYGVSGGGTVIGAASGNMPGEVDAITCQAHHTDLLVDYRGSARLCGQRMIGNIGREKLVDVWNGNEARNFRSEIDATRSACQNCDYLLRCLNPSLTLIENHFSDHLLRHIGDDVRERISYDSDISDDDARNLFISHISERHGFGVYSTTSDHRPFTATRCGSVTRGERSFEAKSRDELYRQLFSDASRTVDVRETMQKYLDSWRNEGIRVAVYPAGGHTAYLLANHDWKAVSIVGLGDSDPSLWGKSLAGHRVMARQELLALDPDVILIASPNYEGEIYDEFVSQRLPSYVKLVRLYS